MGRRNELKSDDFSEFKVVSLDELRERIKNSKSISETAELIAILTDPKYYRYFYVPGLAIERPENLVEEIFFSTENYKIKSNLRKALEKLVVEWRDENKYSIDRLKIYFNLLLRLGAPQSTPLYEWLLKSAKEQNFKDIYSNFDPNPLHLSILALMFYYVYPESGEGLSDVKDIIKRDIRQYPYSHACFGKAWRVSYKLAEDLLPEYFKTAVIENNDEEMFLFQVSNYLESEGINRKIDIVKYSPDLKLEVSEGIEVLNKIRPLDSHPKYSLYLSEIPRRDGSNILLAFKVEDNEIETLSSIEKVKEYLKEKLSEDLEKGNFDPKTQLVPIMMQKFKKDISSSSFSFKDTILKVIVKKALKQGNASIRQELAKIFRRKQTTYGLQYD